MNGLLPLLVVAAAYLLCLAPCSWLVRHVLRHIFTGDQLAAIQTTGLEHAGTYIGYLERVIIITLVLIHQYTAIGLLVAAKSIFRFEEARREIGEYYLIGTLLSIALGLLIGVGTGIIIESL